MTDLVNVTAENQAQQQETVNQNADKLVPQEKVNDLIGVGYNKGYNKGYQKALEELQNQQGNQAAAQPQTSMGGISQQPDIEKIVSTQLEKTLQEREKQMMDKAQQEHANRILQDVSNKVADARTRYSDYDKVVGQYDWKTMPEILLAVSAADNGGDVMYDLANNPAKMGAMLAIAQRSPQSAAAQIRNISDSIKQNQQAVAQKDNLPPEPLDQISPSNVGLDNGKRSLRDLKKIYRT
jgi:hypothetical protein